MSARNFAQIPEALLYDSDVSNSAVRIYGVIQRYAGKRGNAFPGREELAERLGVHVNTIKRGLVELADAGWIERTRRPGSNIWDTALRTVPAPGGGSDRGTKNDPTVGTKNGPRSHDRGTKNDPASVPKTTRPSVPKMVRLDEREPMNESQLTRVTAHASGDAASAALVVDIRRPAADPDPEIIDAEIIEDTLPGMPVPAPCEPDPVQALVGAYVLAVESNGGIATKAQRGAIGRNVKRLIADDRIPLPVLLVAVQRAGSKRSRTVDPFLGEVQAAYGRESTRRAMFARWEEIAERIDQNGQPA